MYVVWFSSICFICCSYWSMSKITVVRPLSAGKITICWFFASVFVAYRSSFLILLCFILLFFKIPDTSFLSSAFLPSSLICWQALSVAVMTSSYGMLFGIIAKFNPLLNMLSCGFVHLCVERLHIHSFCVLLFPCFLVFFWLINVPNFLYVFVLLFGIFFCFNFSHVLFYQFFCFLFQCIVCWKLYIFFIHVFFHLFLLGYGISYSFFNKCFVGSVYYIVMVRFLGLYCGHTNDQQNQKVRYKTVIYC